MLRSLCTRLSTKRQWRKPCRKMSMSAGTSAGTSGAAAQTQVKGIAANNIGDNEKKEKKDPLVMYVVVRADLLADPFSWPLGAVIAQGCHACTAALWQYREAEETKEYMAPSNIENMHKVVLAAKDEDQMRFAAEKLKAKGVEHWLWTEHPEEIVTALAVRPYRRSIVQKTKALKKLKLFS